MIRFAKRNHIPHFKNAHSSKKGISSMLHVDYGICIPKKQLHSKSVSLGSLHHCLVQWRRRNSPFRSFKTHWLGQWISRIQEAKKPWHNSHSSYLNIILKPPQSCRPYVYNYYEGTYLWNGKSFGLTVWDDISWRLVQGARYLCLIGSYPGSFPRNALTKRTRLQG